MIVLDSNVVSAIMRPSLNPSVVKWVDRRTGSIWITSITILETRSGLLRLPNGRRRTEMTEAFETILGQLLPGRVLAFDSEAAEAAAELSAERISAGLNIDTLDTQIAGICVSRGASLATRNTRHFADLDIPLVNPWTD